VQSLAFEDIPGDLLCELDDTVYFWLACARLSRNPELFLTILKFAIRRLRATSASRIAHMLGDLVASIEIQMEFALGPEYFSAIIEFVGLVGRYLGGDAKLQSFFIAMSRVMPECIILASMAFTTDLTSVHRMDDETEIVVGAELSPTVSNREEVIGFVSSLLAEFTDGTLETPVLDDLIICLLTNIMPHIRFVIGCHYHQECRLEGLRIIRLALRREDFIRHHLYHDFVLCLGVELSRFCDLGWEAKRAVALIILENFPALFKTDGFDMALLVEHLNGELADIILGMIEDGQSSDASCVTLQLVTNFVEALDFLGIGQNIGELVRRILDDEDGEM
jgi:hypothetical protein